ncbi:MAG: hypothetical protein CM15mV26_0100 [uncultured marine virus]|nr:MAG: hypothetical protein CM15mV26_0100 [uncultured marine virus]
MPVWREHLLLIDLSFRRSIPSTSRIHERPYDTWHHWHIPHCPYHLKSQFLVKYLINFPMDVGILECLWQILYCIIRWDTDFKGKTTPPTIFPNLFF